MTKRGGARAGAGRPAGSTNKEKREIAELAKVHTADALRVLVEIAKTGENEGARVSAANSILDRAYGRPKQAIIGDDGEPPVRITHIELVPVTSIAVPD